ncbi:hypothetical protein KC19_10G010300 [Ceratodon purpureus]|uniref:Ubiquitin n=1 Tax=Ceratodon purpureus TaxID=3225 RepID=A0A8T0GFW1_CERPU|nr:hypothetical protein KC19_10G010300 [Ceratodon purpureus]
MEIFLHRANRLGNLDVLVNYPNILMEVKDSNTVIDLKFKILETQGLCSHDQNLKLSTYFVRDFEDGRILGYYHIRQNSVIRFSVLHDKDGTQIFVRKSNGETINPDGETIHTVEQLRFKIFEREGIPPKYQRLIYGGQKLEDGRTLSSYDIERGAVIYLAVDLFEFGKNLECSLEIHVFDSKRIFQDYAATPFKLDGLDTIEVLKLFILEKGGIPPDQQRLIYRGQKLEDGRTLLSYDIGQGSTIHLKVICLRASGDSGFPALRLQNGMVIFVKTRTGKTIKLEVESPCSVESLWFQIMEREGVPPCQQRLVFRCNTLRVGAISNYGIVQYSTLHLLLWLKGGACYDGHFVDLENKDGLQKIDFTYIKEQCRWSSKVDSGLNIEGKCTQTSCSAHDKRVICQMKYCVFNVTSDDVHCPSCENTIKATTCGFTDCEWMYTGRKKGSDIPISSEWHVAGDDQYERFCEAGNTLDWDVLIIEAKRTSAVPRLQCPICLFDVSTFEKPLSLACGCRFHSDCVALWKTRETHCPTCRSEISNEAPIASPESRFETNCSSPLTQHNPPLSNEEMCHEGNMPPVKNRFRRLLFRLGLVCN